MTGIKVDDIYNVIILGQENEGNGICKIEDFVVFIDGGLIGDKGDIIITEIHKNYGRGRFLNYDIYSKERISPPCPYYGECGGCDLQHQDYQAQLTFKQNKVSQTLEHIGGLKNNKIKKIISSEAYFYRNKVTLKIEGCKLGFHKNKSNTLIDINKCFLCDNKINIVIEKIREFIIKFPNNGINEVVIKYSLIKDEMIISLIGSQFKLEKQFIEHIISNMTEIKTIVINNKIVYGSGFINGELLNLNYRIASKTFFQVNSKQTLNLFNKILEYGDLSNREIALDLYCGTGIISLLLAKSGKQVIGIEVIEEAISLANENAKLNKIQNVEFILGKVENIIPTLLKQNIDVVILDPPRGGSDNKTLDCIIKLSPKRIVYVSCNPVTLARDLKHLALYYNVIEVTPIDMFPQTKHVETVVLLNLKK